jgi:hypothetical protein
VSSRRPAGQGMLAERRAAVCKDVLALEDSLSPPAPARGALVLLSDHVQRSIAL